VLLCAAPAFAASEFYITDGTRINGAFTNRNDDVFKLSETPYLFVSTDSSQLSLDTIWWNDVNDKTYTTSFGPSTDKSALLGLVFGNGTGEANKTVANWTVDGFLNNFDGSFTTKQAHFSFAPEPISSSLFLLGGASMLIKKRLKKRN